MLVVPFFWLNIEYTMATDGTVIITKKSTAKNPVNALSRFRATNPSYFF
jgi:hypothetical protein